MRMREGRYNDVKEADSDLGLGMEGVWCWEVGRNTMNHCHSVEEQASQLTARADPKMWVEDSRCLGSQASNLTRLSHWGAAPSGPGQRKIP